MLQFAEAPLKPLPDYDGSGGEGGTSRGVGGPLEQSWMQHRCTNICRWGLPISVHICVLVCVWLLARPTVAQPTAVGGTALSKESGRWRLALFHTTAFSPLIASRTRLEKCRSSKECAGTNAGSRRA